MPRFDTVSASVAGQIGGPLSGLSRRTGSIIQVKQLQQLVAKAAQDPETPIRFVAGLLRAYVDLDEIAMAKQGIGRPKPVEARNAISKRKPSTAAGPIGRVSKSASAPLSPKKDIAPPQAPAPQQDQTAPSAPATQEPGAQAK